MSRGVTLRPVTVEEEEEEQPAPFVSRDKGTVSIAGMHTSMPNRWDKVATTFADVTYH